MLGFTSIESIFTGAIVAISSTTIIAKAFEENSVHGRLREIVFGMLIVEDLIAIILLALLTAIASGAGLSATSLGLTLVRLATFLAGLVAVGILIVPRFVRAIVKSERTDTMLVGVIGLCFAAAYLAYTFGYSVALGAFIMGSLVAESGEAIRIERLVHRCATCSSQSSRVRRVAHRSAVIVEHWDAVLLLTVVVITGKVVAVTAGSFITGNGLRHSIQTGMSLAQIGEFSFIIAGVGLAAGTISAFIYPVAVAVSAITTLVTPWLIRGSEPAAMFVDRKLPRPLQTSVALYASWVDRIRNAPGVAGKSKTRRLVRVILIDAVVLMIVIIGAAAERGRFTTMFSDWTGASPLTSLTVVLVGAFAIALPLIWGIVRSARIWGSSSQCALYLQRVNVRPICGCSLAELCDDASARTLLMVGLPIVAITQLCAVASRLHDPGNSDRRPWRCVLAQRAESAEHARAGAEVIVAALSNQVEEDDQEASMNKTMEHSQSCCPALASRSGQDRGEQSCGEPDAGRSQYRGKTGATILAITRIVKQGAK